MKSSRLKAHLQVAKEYAKLSKAERLKVGALIVRDDRPVSVGINGMPSGGNNICEDEHGNTKPEVNHAESNAICFAAANGVSTKDCSLIITHSPCLNCAAMILAAKITEVYYETEYRNLDGVKLLEAYIKIQKVGGLQT